MERRYLRILGIVLVPVVVYLLSFSMVVFYYPAYSNFINLYSSDVSLAQKKTPEVISYFQGNSELEGFSADEASHLKDVRFVIWLLIFVLIVSVIGLFLIRDSKAMVYGGVLSLILPIGLYLLPFEQLFTLFHLIFFPQGNWMFDSSSLLIRMYPFEFFYAFFKNIILRGFILGLVITITFLIDNLKQKLYFPLQQN